MLLVLSVWLFPALSDSDSCLCFLSSTVQVQEVNGIRFWCYVAGHVLGAAMFAVEIAGVRVLYTGDYSREEDRHLKAAEVPPFSPDLCIIESTFGIQIHEPREVRERRFVDLVSQTVLDGGRVLIPAFVFGRAQELLLILDEHWRTHPELQHIPLLYASPLARKAMVLYSTYTGSMNDHMRQQCERTDSNPFDFKFIKPLRAISEFEDKGALRGIAVLLSPISFLLANALKSWPRAWLELSVRQCMHFLHQPAASSVL